MDWDLQASIVGCSSEAIIMTMDNSSVQDDQYLFCNFQELSETTAVVDELEELYKPIYPDVSNIVTSSPLISEEVKTSDKVAVLQDPEASKCKRRKKNEKKKRVEHVRGDGVSDQWAWRKYGQKPIKGSPYPRSYYRCSSFKGCSARKQVERSHTDPGVFIVTYTAEHSHPIQLEKTHHQHNTLFLSPGITAVAVDVPNNIVELEQMKDLKKEEEDGDHIDWFPSIELEELNDFMDTTWFTNQCI